MISRVLLVTVLLIVSIALTGAEKAAVSKFYVSVDVTCEDPIFKNIIASHVKRELRNLGDVEIDTLARYTLSLVVGEHTYGKEGVKTGWVSIAVQGRRYFQFSNFVHTLPEKMQKDVEEAFIGFLVDRNLDIYEKTSLSVWVRKRENTKSFCEEIVADFDSKFLEPDR